MPTVPDARGYFGEFGGRFVPETLMGALIELERAYAEVQRDPAFEARLDQLLRDYVGRPTPLYFAGAAHGARRRRANLPQARRSQSHRRSQDQQCDWADIARAAARQEASHCGDRGGPAWRCRCHRLCPARARMPCLHGREGCRATACQRVTHEIARRGSRSRRKRQPHAQGRDQRGDARWITDASGTHYVIGSVVGPHPYPTMVRGFQAIIGQEARRQSLDQIGRLPEAVVACVGGGSNAIGIFHAFRDDRVRLIGVEGGGHGACHSATLGSGSPGVLHGARSYLLQDANGQVSEAHSISAGLDYPGVGPEHSFLKDSGRAEYVAVNDDEALAAFHLLARLEGILPALESSHAIAHAVKLAPTLGRDAAIVVNLSGRGDKDLGIVGGQS